MIYNVVIEEHIADVFEIEADSPEEAIEKVEQMYYDDEINLDLAESLHIEFYIE